MRVVLRTIATLLLVVGVPMAWVSTATADAPMQAGWWFKLNAVAAPEAPAAPVPVPVEVTASKPPTVPEGGLYVANDPSGPAAVAAVQLAADEGGTGTFTLKGADGGTGEPLIVACPSVGVWTAAEGGAWDEKPDWDCDAGKILGSVADDGTITFALDGSVAAPGGGFDIVLLPDPDSGTPFQTPFEPPADDAWQPVGGSSTGELGTSSGGSDVAAETGDAGSTSFESGGGSAETGGGDVTSDFGSGEVDTGTPPIEGDAGAGAEQPGAPLTASGEEAANQAQPIADDDSGTERLTAIGLLVAIAAGLFWVSSRTGAATAEARAAGVGRFARPRLGRPNGLT